MAAYKFNTLSECILSSDTMNIRPLVSIHLTTFNRGSLLPRAIKSVLKQTFTDWELIIVNDGSTDSTRRILSRYTRNRRIKVFTHPNNLGNAAARNTALNHSRGEYVAFLDDDDEWIDTDKLTKQFTIFNTAEDPRLGIVCSSVCLAIGKDVIPRIISPPNNLVSFILSGNGLIYSPTVMTTGKLMRLAGGFDSKLKRGVDSEYYRCCIVKHGAKVHFMKDITTKVYVHSGSRLTPYDNPLALKNNLSANLYIIRRYWPQYLTHPASFITRLWSVFLILANLLKVSL